jgi:hypothetical protein
MDIIDRYRGSTMARAGGGETPNGAKIMIFDNAK